MREAVLTNLAESVADGTPADWQAGDAAADVRVRRLAGHLRLVERIASLHRSISEDEARSDVAAKPAVEPPDARRWGRLVLREPIGSGTSGDVYRAWDPDLELDVALKLLRGAGSPDAERRVIEEARRLARVRHHHVVQVYGADKHDDRVGLWMELVIGRSLEHVVQERGPLGPGEAALVGIDVCDAVAAVHGARLLHRDIKAQNVVRENGGRIVLMDFGTGEDLAGSSRIVGTPLYLAPEILYGGRGSVQSDVYSIGVLLYYLVTGEFPVTAASMKDLVRAHRSGARRRLRDLRPDAPEGFVRALEAALDAEAARRFASVQAFEEALREALIVRPYGPSHLPVPAPLPAARSAFRLRQVGVFLAILIALVLLALLMTNFVRL